MRETKGTEQGVSDDDNDGEDGDTTGMKTARPRLHLTPKALAYVVCDVFGMALFASGALWLARGLPLFFSGFPATRAEAFIALAGGLTLMVYAMGKVLREMLETPPPPAEPPS